MKLSLLSSLLASALLLSACGEKTEENPAVAASEASAASNAEPAAAAMAKGAAASAPSAADVSEAKLRAYVCNAADPGCRAGADPLRARSVEEARWLVEHGYPTKEEQERLKALTLSQVKAEADAGNPSAKVVYASKLSLEPGKFHEGTLLLHDQAVAGNLYAYYGLSEAYWNSKENRDLIDSAAYLRVAYLLGDSRAGDKIGTLKLSQVELAVADQRAASLLNTFAGGLQTSRRPLE